VNRPRAEGVLFEADDGFALVAFERAVSVEASSFGIELGLELPNGAQGSWLAARLARLFGLDSRLFTGAVEVEPDGLFIADVLALDARERVLAKLQLQASPEEIALLGVAGSPEAARRAQAALRRVLLAAPEDLADVEVRVEGPEGETVFGRREGRLLASPRRAP
jgi:hypothetical protein